MSIIKLADARRQRANELQKTLSNRLEVLLHYTEAIQTRVDVFENTLNMIEKENRAADRCDQELSQ